MRPSFLPRLVNNPFADPGLFIPFLFSNHALLMDSGDMGSLSSKDILKISHVFVSHTHMDHFGGFDTLLRIFLGRDKTLHVFGPPGFLKNVEGKLAAYSWNLVHNYVNRFSIQAHEIREDKILSRNYDCRDGFTAKDHAKTAPFDPAIVEKPGYTVFAVMLDHGIPSLGYILRERFHINIKKDAVLAQGLSIGPWLNRFKQAVYASADPNGKIHPDVFFSPEPKRRYPLGKLMDTIAVVTVGQKIAYVADVGYTPENIRRITTWAKGADQLFIEGAFLEKHKEIAKAKHHLTARQAGEIAALSEAKQFTIFHFSPRYTGMENALYEEAAAAYHAISGQCSEP